MPNLHQNTMNKFSLPKKTPTNKTQQQKTPIPVCVLLGIPGEQQVKAGSRKGAGLRHGKGRTTHRNEATVTSCGHTLLKDPEVWLILVLKKKYSVAGRVLRKTDEDKEEYYVLPGCSKVPFINPVSFPDGIKGICFLDKLQSL